jgi:hypothetical protein
MPLHTYARPHFKEVGRVVCRSVAGRVARFFLLRTYQIGKNIPNEHKLYQNSHKIYQMVIHYTHFPFQGPPKFTQIAIFGLKINHLATLLLRWNPEILTKIFFPLTGRIIQAMTNV